MEDVKPAQEPMVSINPSIFCMAASPQPLRHLHPDRRSPSLHRKVFLVSCKARRQENDTNIFIVHASLSAAPRGSLASSCRPRAQPTGSGAASNAPNIIPIYRSKYRSSTKSSDHRVSLVTVHVGPTRLLSVDRWSLQFLLLSFKASSSLIKHWGGLQPDLEGPRANQRAGRRSGASLDTTRPGLF